MAMESRWLESGPAHTAAPASAHDDAAKIAASMAGVADREAKAVRRLSEVWLRSVYICVYIVAET